MGLWRWGLLFSLLRGGNPPGNLRGRLCVRVEFFFVMRVCARVRACVLGAPLDAAL